MNTVATNICIYISTYVKCKKSKCNARDSAFLSNK